MKMSSISWQPIVWKLSSNVSWMKSLRKGLRNTLTRLDWVRKAGKWGTTARSFTWKKSTFKNLSRISGSSTLKDFNGCFHIITRVVLVGLGIIHSTMHLSLAIWFLEMPSKLSKYHKFKVITPFYIDLNSESQPRPLSSWWVCSLGRVLTPFHCATVTCYRMRIQKS